MFDCASEDTYRDGQVIFREGSPGDWVYMVHSGSVIISKEVKGKRFIIEVLKKGDIFGELSFFGGVKRAVTATAAGATKVAVIDRTTLDPEMNRLSSDLRALQRAMVKRYLALSDRACDFFVRAAPRLQRTLSLSYQDRTAFLKAYASNIGSGGLFIQTSNPLAKGEAFLLKLQLPGIPQQINIKCEVIWVKKEGEEPAPAEAGRRDPSTPALIKAHSRRGPIGHHQDVRTGVPVKGAGPIRHKPGSGRT